MSAAGDFIDATLQRESSWERAEADRARLGGGLTFYGASVGVIRGTVRDAGRRHPGLDHDDITALSSELWAAPVFERRLAAVVLLQSQVRMLRASDLTRIEGFLRTARLPALVDPLTTDVVRPLIDALTGPASNRANIVLGRWAHDPSAGLRRAAGLLGVGAGDDELTVVDP